LAFMERRAMQPAEDTLGERQEIMILFKV